MPKLSRDHAPSARQSALKSSRNRLQNASPALLWLFSVRPCRKSPMSLPSQLVNRLDRETSPYLLQHAHNPVAWQPWDEQALALARTQDKPIFLSIGYSACHWCHVMERESFEDAETAAYLNAHFVSIKVDREERPDLDAIYMEAVQLMTRHGGWPMSVFLMPDSTPFHGGTYFPPTPRQGMPSFRQVLEAVVEAFATRRADLQTHGTNMVAQMVKLGAHPPASRTVTPTALLSHAVDQLQQRFDAHYGGFGSAPKFPQPMTVDFLLMQAFDRSQRQARHMAEFTLDRMLSGGIYDQLGGGFHRYSVDPHWLVPHFEKMLYDNAQLLGTYLRAWQMTGKADYLRVVQETIAYLLREMTRPEGGFYSAQDADSEGEEGLFFLWDQAEIEAILEPQAAQAVCLVMGVSAGGNFEGRNILHRPHALEECGRRLRMPPRRLQDLLRDALPRLWTVREQREKPARDDKILTEWNGLLISALAQCGAVLPHPAALQAARHAADFIWQAMRLPDGSLLRSYRAGQARNQGVLEDYAAYGLGLLDLFAADANPKWLERGEAVAARILTQFADPESGAFFQTGRDHETLVMRRKEYIDNAVPSGNSLTASLFLRLAHITGEDRYRQWAAPILAVVEALLAAQPTAFGRMLCAYADLHAPTQEVVIVGDPDDPATQALTHAARQPYHPRRLVLQIPPERDTELPVWQGKGLWHNRPAAYVCHHHVCHQPVTRIGAMLEQMQRVGPKTQSL